MTFFEHLSHLEASMQSFTQALEQYEAEPAVKQFTGDLKRLPYHLTVLEHALETALETLQSIRGRHRNGPPGGFRQLQPASNEQRPASREQEAFLVVSHIQELRSLPHPNFTIHASEPLRIFTDPESARRHAEEVVLTRCQQYEANGMAVKRRPVTSPADSIVWIYRMDTNDHSDMVVCRDFFWVQKCPMTVDG